MQETLLSPDGSPLITPEELEQGPSILPTRDTDPTTIHRLCEIDEISQLSCRRTQTSLAIEAEFNTYVSPYMYWGFWDQWCEHEGHCYYDKDQIEKRVLRENSLITEDKQSQDMLTIINSVVNFVGNDFHTPPSLSSVHDFFKNPAPGFPSLQIETPQFFQCSGVGTTQILIDDLTRDMLNQIQETFTGDKNPFLVDLTGRMYLFENNIYCTDYLAYEENPNGKLGVLMSAPVSEKYTTGKYYFFPFSPLNAEQEQFIRNLCSIESEMQQDVIIITL
jgi:hypothetical protein